MHQTSRCLTKISFRNTKQTAAYNNNKDLWARITYTIYISAIRPYPEQLTI